MRRYLLSLIPWTAASFGLCFLVKAFGGPWPDWWYFLAAALIGFAIGTRRLADL